MKTLLITLPIALLATAFSIAAAGQTPAPRGLPSIAFISAARAGSESTASKADVAKYQALQTQKQNELRAKQQMLESTRSQLAQATDATKRTALQQEEQRERTELERATVQAQTDLQNAQRQLQLAFQGRLKTAVEDLVKGQNYQLILNADTTLIWAAPGAAIDLTGALVERMNAAPTSAPPAKP
jgi:Skp family chaperone for outer membrane proteins